MKKLFTTLSLGAVILTAAFLVNAASSAPTFAQENESQPSEETAQADTSTENYTYVAQPGDSYSQMARKALQTYGIQTDTQIGGAGILFAEAHLTNIAGSPLLNEGQAVSISKASVKEWFDKAAKLSAEEKANWSYYIPFVDFNTDHVGEAPKS